ncbi:iron exporter MbfA [Mangrovibrevibacter kandeliae]|uniref:iron exporter MbfA n=1 Tax=Mangrovibrevibacter kandeliae TaxID=2968473 RepID=UPI002118CA4D|nr:ferritin family protein [Aurantimonas sp. CSK15Z-1]MCQ8780596.1 rubrerythrin family protein [Aurantimonas sp. CSK15Z-1]
MELSLGRRPRIEDLTEAQILALAIGAEEEDARIYRDYAEALREDFPASAAVFDDMAAEEDEHRRLLIERFRASYGERIPLVRRADVAGFYHRRADWLVRPLGIEAVRASVAHMERQSADFYRKAARHVQDAQTRRLLGDLATAEAGHEATALVSAERHLTAEAKATEAETERRAFVLTYVQPGLAGLMDGSVSTLAPIFAAAFATRDPAQTLLVGLAAAIGAGISMGFTEAVSDDGVLSGRGSPLKRGLACGIMTAIGGLGHALPYLIPDFWTATALAFAVVFVELWAIAFVQSRYMDTPLWRAAIQVILGGALVFATGIVIGAA